MAQKGAKQLAHLKIIIHRIRDDALECAMLSESRQGNNDLPDFELSHKVRGTQQSNVLYNSRPWIL